MRSMFWVKLVVGAVIGLIFAGFFGMCFSAMSAPAWVQNGLNWGFIPFMIFLVFNWEKIFQKP